MDAQPIATASSDMPPPTRAAETVAVATSDFAQLLGATTVQPSDATPATSGNVSTGTSLAASTGTNSATATPVNGRSAKKHNDDNSATAILLAALTALQPTPQSAVSVSDASQPLSTDPIDDRKTTKSVADPTSAAVADLNAAAPAAPETPPRPSDPGTLAPMVGGNRQAGANSAPLPAGAAALNAQVSIGPPIFLSRPMALLAGNSHVPAPTPTAPSDADAASASQSTAVDYAATAASTDKADASFATAVQAQLHDAGGDDAASVAAGVSAAPTDAPDPQSTPQGTLPLPGTAQSSSASPSTIGTASPPAPPTFAPPPLFEQVAFTLRQAAASDGASSTINIQLKPASLGAIQVKLDIGHDGKISAVISADRSDTLNLLRQDSQGLEQALRDAGLRADSGSLSFNLRGDPQSYAQTASGTPGSPASPAQNAPSTLDAPTLRHSRHTGALDIEV
jgi:flagellar hook-length control protein FliK